MPCFEKKEKKNKPPLKNLLDSMIVYNMKQKNKVKSVCLCLMFNREDLRSVEQGLVLHGLLVNGQQGALQRTDAACYHLLVSWSEYFLPPPPNLSNNHPRASSVAQRGERHWPCWSVTGAAAHRCCSALRLRPTSDSPSVVRGQKGWLPTVIHGR